MQQNKRQPEGLNVEKQIYSVIYTIRDWNIKTSTFASRSRQIIKVSLYKLEH